MIDISALDEAAAEVESAQRKQRELLDILLADVRPTGDANPFGYQRLSVQQYLALLKRVPPDTFTTVMASDMDLSDAETCLVGTAITQAVAGLLHIPSDEVAWDSYILRVQDLFNIDDGDHFPEEWEIAAKLFGGNEKHWHSLFVGVIDHKEYPKIELALSARLDLALKGK